MKPSQTGLVFRVSRASPGNDAVEGFPETLRLRSQAAGDVEVMQRKAGERKEAVGETSQDRREIVPMACDGKPRRRAASSEQGYSGKREDDVAQGAGMEEEYLHYSITTIFGRLRLAMLTCAATFSAI
jgi:hypothetical protein